MRLLLVLRIAGVISLLGAIGHLLFPLMPEWGPALEIMPIEIRNIFITYHYVMVVMLGIMGYITTFQAKQLISNPIAGSIAALFASLYVIRIVTEFMLWKAPMPQAAVILPFCIIPIVAYAFLLFKPERLLYEAQ